MKVTDLMVGDWVNYKSPSSGKLRPIKIKNIYGAEFNCEVEDWNIISGKSISDTEPIKLTSDILVKNGFAWEKQDLIEVMVLKLKHNKTITLEYVGWSGGLWTSHDHRYVQIWYVHQLQHLLRLCGIEKEIEL